MRRAHAKKNVMVTYQHNSVSGLPPLHVDIVLAPVVAAHKWRDDHPWTCPTWHTVRKAAQVAAFFMPAAPFTARRDARCDDRAVLSAEDSQPGTRRRREETLANPEPIDPRGIERTARNRSQADLDHARKARSRERRKAGIKQHFSVHVKGTRQCLITSLAAPAPRGASGAVAGIG